jgi:hypothetical protein
LLPLMVAIGAGRASVAIVLNPGRSAAYRRVNRRCRLPFAFARFRSARVVPRRSVPQNPGAERVCPRNGPNVPATDRGAIPRRTLARHTQRLDLKVRVRFAMLPNVETTMYNEQNLRCGDCKSTFAFTVYEQQEFTQKGYMNKPGRCPQCRTARKASGISGPSPRHKVRQ